jgi:tetratricopeptide (TPR) repeat protein/predicted Ser/Thr protein kinase
MAYHATVGGDRDDATIAETPRAGAGKRVAGLPDRYRIVETLGEGGMGRVYRAHDTVLGRDVAIKVIERAQAGPDQTLQRERFVREAQAAARLAHPNIVTVHDVDPEAGWLVMELIEGVSLRDLAEQGRVPPATLRSIADQILAALDAAHAAGIIHRDVKPSNIIVGSAGKVTLVDFGVARLVYADLTRTGENVGTPAYMAPEQVRGRAVDARTDLYGLGATLYEQVMGERILAFESPGPEVVRRLEAACGTERALAAVIARCLQGDPDRRFASAVDAKKALDATTAPPVAPARRARWPWIAAGVVAAGAIAGGVIVGTRGGDAPRAPDKRMTQAFTLAQRGEHEKAAVLLEDFIAEHPGDGDALALKFLVDWWQSGDTSANGRVLSVRLAPAQRAMVHGVDLIAKRREVEAIGYLEGADREVPGQAEILFTLGEARWHGQQLEAGAETLERAFAIDPRWQMALHHVVEFRLSRGEADHLRPIADTLRMVDPAAAAALDCKILIGERRYAEAIESAALALGKVEQIAELYICKAQAETLAGDLAAAQVTAKRAFDLWPIDLREWGGFAYHAEQLLYRGDLDGYLALVREKPSRQRTLALALWRPTPTLAETGPTGPGMRMPPLGAATFILVGWVHGRDEVAVYRDYPELEVRAYGTALWAETKGDLDTAIAEYTKALEVPAKGDLRMLVAHHLARVYDRKGDRANAAKACEEIVAPRRYEPYRAVVLPDCLVWTGTPVSLQGLVDTWTGAFQHPAVVEARQRLRATRATP